MITYCPPQRHLADSRSEEGISGWRNVNNLYQNKNCLEMNSYNLLSKKPITYR